MKNRIAIVIAVLISVFALSAYAAELPPVTVTLDGEIVNCESYGQQATIVNGRTLVPLRAIFEALGASVQWDAQNYVVTSTLGEITISLKIGENTLYRNGAAIGLDVPAMLMNDRTMIPVRAVSEAFGIKVDWIEKNRTVVLLSDSYVRGIRSDDTYYGEWLGFNYNLADGFVFTDEKTLFEQMSIVSISENDVDFASLLYVCEFEASDDEGNTLSVCCEKKNNDMTPEEYLEEAVKVYELSGINATIGENYEITLAGKKCLAVDAEAEYLGVEFTQSIAVFEKDKRMVSFMFTYMDSDSLQRMISGFGEYVKPSVKPEIYETASDNESFGSNEYIYSEKHHAYGEFYLGMTKGEAKRAANGECIEKNGGTTINIFDEKNVYNDEDKRITSDANCDLISLTFDNGTLKRVYVSTEYMTLEKAEKILENVVSYYGEPEYVFETEEGFYDTYFWSDTNVCIDCTIVCEKDYGYSCVLEVYTAN